MNGAATLALVDCPTGLAGNMLLAALLDLGLPQAAVEAPLAQLGLAGCYRLQLEQRRMGGLRGLHLAVEVLEPDPPHRHWRDLRALIAGASLDPVLQRRVLAVFARLAEAEAAVHGHSADEVHFHEVGAMDALVDVVGVCAGLQHFGIQQLLCTPPPAGHGSVATAHGLLPVPVPAVLELACRAAVPLASSAGFPPAELTTPTGLVLMAELADGFQPLPAHRPLAVGVGLGSRELDRPNLLRIVLAEPLEPAGGAMAGQPQLETVLQQQAQIDDATPEELAFLAEQLRQAGALEVFSQAVQMKKGRQAVLLSVLAEPAAAAQLRQIWWRFGTSLGLREQWQQRWVLPREQLQLDTPWGPVRVKRAQRPDGTALCKPEYEDLAAIARREGLPLAELRQRVLVLLEASS